MKKIMTVSLLALIGACFVTPVFAKSHDKGKGKHKSKASAHWQEVHAKLRRLSFNAQINDEPKSTEYSSEIIQIILTDTQTVFARPASPKIGRQLKEIDGLDRVVARFYKGSVYHTAVNTERLSKLYDLITTLIMDIKVMRCKAEEKSDCDKASKAFAKDVDEQFGDRMDEVHKLLGDVLADKRS
ncbi:MAG: hypothetical protein Tsb0018_09740 [Opitutales bacterium]